MKKFLIFIAAVFLLTSVFCMASLATEPEIEQNKNNKIVSVSNNLISEEELSCLFNKDLYEEDVKDISLEGKLIVKAYRFHDYIYITDNFSPEALINKANSRGTPENYYIIGDDKIDIVKMHCKEDETVVISKPEEDYLHTYTSLQNELINIEYLVAEVSEDCNITGLCIFDGNAFFGPRALSLYIFTDTGFFIREFFDSQREPGIWIEKEKYETYALGFQEYLEAYRSSPHEVEIGGGPGFEQYIRQLENPSPKNTKTENNVSAEPEPDLTGTQSPPKITLNCSGTSVIPAFISLSALSLAAIIFKKKNY